MYQIFRHAYILAQRKLRFAFRLRISKWFDLSFRIDVTAPRPICQQIGRGFLLLQHRLDDRSGLTCLHRLRLVTLRAQDGQPSRLQHSYAFLFDIQRGVYVSVMMSAAMRTRPAACCKAQFLELVTAGGTCLRRRKEGADLCKDSAFMLRLVFALAHEFSPSCIGNRLCEMVILHHALNFQSLENQRLVIVN